MRTNGFATFIALLLLTACATPAPGPSSGLDVAAAAERLDAETQAQMEVQLSEAFRSRSRCESLVDLIFDLHGDDPDRIKAARFAYIDAAAAGDDALESYKRTLDKQLFGHPKTPSLEYRKGEKVSDSTKLMLEAEARLRAIATQEKAGNSVQTINAVFQALNGVYDLIWNIFQKKQQHDSAVKEAYLLRVEKRVDGYRWKSWDTLTAKPERTSQVAK